MTEPQPQHTFSGRISRVIDGDTVEVEVCRKMVVRLRDCWAPETKRTRHPSEKALGIEAKERMENLAKISERCAVRILPDGDDDIGDGLTFGRVVADVWLGDGIGWLSDRMIESGQAFRTKAELKAFLTEQDKELHDAI